MTRLRLHKTNRSAFTLVELLMVIAIITILVSMVAAGLMKVLNQVSIVSTRTEISEMEGALRVFMQDYNLSDPPPSYLLIAEDTSLYPQLMANPATFAAATQTVQFFQKWFGRNFLIGTGFKYNWNGNTDAAGNPIYDPPYVLEGEQCLVFYLGGIPAYTTSGSIGMTGFCPSVQNPALAATPGAPRKGPYYTFNANRLALTLPSNPSIQNPLHFPVYIDAWNVKLTTGNFGPQPYAYFSTSGRINAYNILTASIGGDCNSIGANAYYEGVTASGLPSYMNNNGMQIISAGQDGIFGYDPTKTFPGGVPWSPLQGATGNGRDDQANFSARVLGAGQS